MQQFVNGTKTEHHLCAACSMMAEMPISFENLFQGVLDSILSLHGAEPNSPQKEAATVKCPGCGMTDEQFKSTGKLGCAECYHTFTAELGALLKNVQGSIHHEGKFPQRAGVVLRQKHEIDRLRIQLTKAVEGENFEEAARLRDNIRALTQTAKEVEA
jgi:protein arginine kinase activator